MASKRPAEEAGGSTGGPPAKKHMTRFDPFNVGTVYNLVCTCSSRRYNLQFQIVVLKFQANINIITCVI